MLKIALISLVASQALGTLEASQLAANSFTFILAAPSNCLQTLNDLPPSSASKNMAAMWIRAAFHDAGTWDGSSGGADNSLLSFLNEEENAGLSPSIAPKFMQNSAVQMTKADMIALAGQISVTHCGGPSMPFRAGRVDTTLPTSPLNRIPLGNSSLAAFKPRLAAMGWTDEDLVVLVTGSHTMGGIHGKNSPSLTSKPFVPFDDTPGIFDNNVFKKTLEGYCPVPIDCEIANDPALRPLVQRYADDQQAFFDQYAFSFRKLIDQTSSPLGQPQSLNIPLHVGLYSTNQVDGSRIVTDETIGSTPEKTRNSAHRLDSFILGLFFSFFLI
jgi:L-ascorbate peroxidase